MNQTTLQVNEVFTAMSITSPAMNCVHTFENYAGRWRLYSHIVSVKLASRFENTVLTADGSD